MGLIIVLSSHSSALFWRARLVNACDACDAGCVFVGHITKQKTFARQQAGVYVRPKRSKMMNRTEVDATMTLHGSGPPHHAQEWRYESCLCGGKTLHSSPTCIHTSTHAPVYKFIYTVLSTVCLYFVRADMI